MLEMIVAKGILKRLKYKETWGKELHRDDLIYCPRKAYYRIKGYTPKLDYQTLLTFLVGKAVHDVIEEALGYAEIKLQYEGVHASIDSLYRGCPLEIKTTTKAIFNPYEIPKEWIEQLDYGILFTGKHTGYLLLFDLLTKTIVLWRRRLTDSQLKELRRTLIKKRNLILKAVEVDDVDMLEKHPEECSTCGYKYICRGEENGETD